MMGLESPFNVIDFLALAALLWHVANFAVILKNRKGFKRLRPLNKTNSLAKISVLIPARNEEKNLGNLLQSLALQTVTPFEVVVCDDHSDDKSAEIAASFKTAIPSLRVFTPDERPPGWLGKNWACHELSKRANGDFLLFVDADVTFEPETIADTCAQLEHEKPGLLTVWPHQLASTLWQKSALTTMYFTLLAFLPAVYVSRKPRWMPAFFHRRFKTLFAAACGQFMLFSKEAYRACGGHERVRDEVVEDVNMAKHVLETGKKVVMFNGTGSVNCRMYQNDAELFQGFRKNFFAGFGYNWFLFLFMAVAHVVVYFLPLVLLFHSNFDIHLTSAVTVMIIVVNRMLFLQMYDYPVVWAVFSWTGVLWFQVLGVRCMLDRAMGKKPLWKNRVT